MKTALAARGFDDFLAVKFDNALAIEVEEFRMCGNSPVMRPSSASFLAHLVVERVALVGERHADVRIAVFQALLIGAIAGTIAPPQRERVPGRRAKRADVRVPGAKAST